MDRAFSTVEIKSISETDDVVRIEGIASTPSVDRMGDIVNPMGAQFKTPFPLLWQHSHDKPVGHVVWAEPNKKGIPFRAEIPRVKEEGTLKDRVDEAIQSLKYKLINATSIGFSAIEGKIKGLPNGGLHFEEWNWHELSLVTIPAQPEAVITSVKSLNKEFMASAGRDVAADDSGQKKRGPVYLTPTRKSQTLKIIPRNHNG